MKERPTLDDLVKFCAEQKLQFFSSKGTGYKLCIQVPATFEKDEKNDASLLFATVKCFHTGVNRNRSCVLEEAAKKAMETIAYKPILANFTIDENGNPDFTAHDMEIDENGKTIYIERQIGCFTADEPYFEQDPDHEDRKYVMARVAIPREYTEAANIIERKNGTKVSVELYVNEMKYDAKNKYLVLSDIEVSGLTLLGVNPESKEPISEGMEGSRLDIEDFSIENNIRHFSLTEEIKQFIQASIKEVLNDKNYLGKEENSMEGFEENVEVADSSQEDVVGVDEQAVEETVTGESSDDTFAVTEAESEETEDAASSEGELTDNFATMSVTVNGTTRTFSRSLVEKLNALSELVNVTYSETDNDYYFVDADEDNKEVYAHSMWTDSHFKQKYSVRNDIYSLQGDRVTVYARYLTEDEISRLDQMKANYDAISEKLQKYEQEPEKMKILNSSDYASISNSDEFVAFKEQDAHFNLTVDDVRNKCDEMLLNAAKAGKVDFSNNDDKKTVTMKKLPIGGKSRSGRYGNLFPR